jgi:N-acetylglucosamine-6-phosphate deacetylase
MNQTNGFFDLQLNGYGGVDFNRDGLTAEQLHQACLRLEEGGVGGVLPTVVTDDVETMAGRLAALARFRGQDELARRMIAGLHVEGPFLNETAGFRGAHAEEKIRPADEKAMGRLLEAGGGLVRVVTLAPERDAGLKVTRMLARSGIVVAAGHCDPSLDLLKAAIDAGLSMFTHLGNGCPMQMHRHENIIQRGLSLRGRLWLTFIGDGHHIPLYALGNYIRAAGLDKVAVVTDGQAASGMGPGRYTLGRWEIVVGQDRRVAAPDGSFLLGSTATMTQCHENLLKGVGLSEADARRLTAENPRKALGMR